MRACVVVTIGWLVVGCYRPPTEAHCSVACGADGACPSGLACNAGGICSPGAVACDIVAMDATGSDGAPPIDGTSSACNAFANQPQLLFRGDSYTKYGVYSAWRMDDLKVYAVRGNSTYTITTTLVEPRLSPDGNELLMIDGAKALHRTIWTGSAWTMPAPITTNMMVIPGTMTEAAPRKMIADAGGQLYEGVEMPGGNAWTFSPIGTLGLALAASPSVDPTGTRLVFVGTTIDDGAKAIYLATADPGSASGWSQPELLYDHAGDETTPFLTADCKQLTFSVDGATYLLQ